MKKIATWLAAGVIVASAAACSVEVTNGPTAAGGAGGTGGTGGTGGSTGGASGTSGASGSAGTAGTTGGSGGTEDASSDVPVVTCTSNPNTDGKCGYCGFTQCQEFHCACSALSTCRTPMLQFYACSSMPNAKIDECATPFVINANVDSSGGELAGDLSECMIDKCADTCLGLDAGTLSRNLIESWKASVRRNSSHP
ncbi:MAG TPA: hypothetical protein VK550_06430 [Polyangiaceae bacterium]|nr:hypothetical protein [Polyangiaceae bacterium]